MTAPLYKAKGDIHNQHISFFPISGLLVCTDVMARGVDIPDVQWVIQYDPPSSAR